MFDRSFTLEITDRPDVLARVVTLCQQRRCQVTSLSYSAGDRHRAAGLVLSVRAPSWHGDRLAAWLAGLVDVLDVQELTAAPGLGVPPGSDDAAPWNLTATLTESSSVS